MHKLPTFTDHPPINAYFEVFQCEPYPLVQHLLIGRCDPIHQRVTPPLVIIIFLLILLLLVLILIITTRRTRILVLLLSRLLCPLLLLEEFIGAGDDQFIA